MRTGLLSALLAATALAAIASTPAQACSCKKRTSAQVMAETPVVFEGRVLRVRREGARVYADIETARILKGTLPRIAEVSTAASSAACGYDFRPGAQVVVGALFEQQQFSTNLCIMGPLNQDRARR